MYKKPIIVFEGIEGSGKSYHIKNVSNFLKKKRIKFIKFREPGGSKNSELIRNLLMNKNVKFHKYTDLFLYMAARNENYISILSKNINKKVILIDRFVDSTTAYQHYGMGIDLKMIDYLNTFILKKIKPSFTFLHTVSIKNLKKRLKQRSVLNRYDKFKDNFYNKAQQGFLKLSKKNKSNYMIINSNEKIEFNKKIIIKKISELTS